MLANPIAGDDGQMGLVNTTAENDEINLQTSTISDPLPEITAPAKQATTILLDMSAVNFTQIDS